MPSAQVAAQLTKLQPQPLVRFLRCIGVVASSCNELVSCVVSIPHVCGTQHNWHSFYCSQIFGLFHLWSCLDSRSCEKLCSIPTRGFCSWLIRSMVLLPNMPAGNKVLVALRHTVARCHSRWERVGWAGIVTLSRSQKLNPAESLLHTIQ